MKLETFFEKFDQFADAPDAVAKMRELVLQLAVQGSSLLKTIATSQLTVLLRIADARDEDSSAARTSNQRRELPQLSRDEHAIRAACRVGLGEPCGCRLRIRTESSRQALHLTLTSAASTRIKGASAIASSN